MVFMICKMRIQYTYISGPDKIVLFIWDSGHIFFFSFLKFSPYLFLSISLYLSNYLSIPQSLSPLPPLLSGIIWTLYLRLWTFFSSLLSNSLSLSIYLYIYLSIFLSIYHSIGNSISSPERQTTRDVDTFIKMAEIMTWEKCLTKI